MQLKMPFPVVALSVMCLMSTSSCKHFKPPDQVNLRGIYIEDFERTEFISCDGTRYWVDNPQRIRDVAEKAGQHGRPVEVLASISRGGPFGHASSYDLLIFVNSSREAETPSDCQIMDVLKGAR